MRLAVPIGTVDLLIIILCFILCFSVSLLSRFLIALAIDSITELKETISVDRPSVPLSFKQLMDLTDGVFTQMKTQSASSK